MTALAVEAGGENIAKLTDHQLLHFLWSAATQDDARVVLPGEGLGLLTA
jgi:hypothetical protein